MARKDRERARKRHAIERARKEAGVEAKPREERPSSDRRPPSRPRTGGPQRGQRGPSGPLKKLQVGDVDRRGRVFQRNMILHPRTAMFTSLTVIVLAIVGLFRPGLQWLSYLAFAVGFLVFADSQHTRRRALLWAGLAGVCAVFAVYLFVQLVL